MSLLKQSLAYRWTRAVTYLGLGLFFFLVPGIQVVCDLNDSALRTGGIPAAAWRLHYRLAPRYAAWANAQIASDRAGHLDLDNAAGTEWPLFGSVFYSEASHRLK